MKQGIAAIAIAVALSGCAGERVWAPDEAVQAARYAPGGQPELMLITSINDRSGEGAHSALVINASERVLFDPAGNWDSRYAPERNDVRYGFTPQMQASYFAFQSHGPYHAVIQRIPVSGEAAELALQLAKSNGPVPDAFCASATSGILRQLPGFGNVTSTMFPRRLMESVADMPGVQTTVEFGSPDEADPNRVPKMSPVIVAATGIRPGA
ncbi:hypothetical protein [Gemmobacter megaterium]|uniref:hypothetical protein n=1 Tax=Gemmobacter megaterium TaxID=1086013 RepID=UPI0009707635|nr:hypothetical protein [Gemmobacter megaterium]